MYVRERKRKSKVAFIRWISGKLRAKIEKEESESERESNVRSILAMSSCALHTHSLCIDAKHFVKFSSLYGNSQYILLEKLTNFFIFLFQIFFYLFSTLTSEKNPHAHCFFVDSFTLNIYFAIHQSVYPAHLYFDESIFTHKNMYIVHIHTQTHTHTHINTL